MEDADDDLPEFFKVYISHHSSHKMLIPGEFVDYMGGKKSGSAELAGPSGQSWQVELVEDGKDMYFSDGWRSFVDDNMVRDGDFLFFKFHGNLMFSVMICDDSMCEKEVKLVRKCSQGTNAVQEAGHGQDVVKPMKRAEHSQPKGSLFPSKFKTVELTPTSMNPSFEKRISVSSLKWGCYLMLPSSFVREYSLSYKNREKMVLQTSRNSTWEVSVINSCGAIILRKGWCAFTRENNLRVGDVCKFELLDRLKMLVHVTHRQVGIRRKKVNMASSKRSLKTVVAISQRTLRPGSAFVTEEQKTTAMTVPPFVSPSFVTRMKKYNVERTCLVSIPYWFMEENSLHYERKEKMVLRTETDASWSVNIIQCKKNRSLCGGWAAFVHDNNIKEGDTCKFELVSRLEMKVYITPRSQQG